MSLETDRWYNVVFSITRGGFTNAQLNTLAAMDVAFEVLYTNATRMIVDIIGPRAQLQALQDALTALGRDPRVICIHDFDGNLIGQPNKAEFIAVSGEADWVERHQFAGWHPRLVP